MSDDSQLKSSDPDLAEDLVGLFIQWDGANFPIGYRPNLSAHYEHGQWWIVDGASGACWSVVDAEGGDSIEGFSFEVVDSGDFED